MTVSPTQLAVERYRAAFADFEHNHPAASWLAKMRRQAIERFAQTGFPTTRDEEWKYTDITPVANLAVTPIFAPETNGKAPVWNGELPFADVESARLVFLNGHFSPEHSSLKNLPSEIEVCSLAEAFADDSEVVQEHFGRALGEEADVFAALNTAFAQDGAFIRIPGNVQVETPIHLLFLTTGEAATVSHPRNLILIGANSSATIIETYAGNGVYFTNSATEIIGGANAQLEHIKIQNESEKAFHIATLHIIAARDSRLKADCLNFGGRIVRNTTNALMGDENAEITLNGLVVANGEQHIDNHTAMDHAQPHCDSHENYAHVLDGHSNGVFNGKIFVRIDAQKTDAKQSNRSLLLSKNAQINAKPQLEIFADDVKCTHGATIGQLDMDALFYLRARGLPETEARKILVRAFAGEVIEAIGNEPLREKLETMLSARLG